MGNTLSTAGVGPSSAAARSATGIDSFLSELGGDVQYDKSMGTSRFLKTIRARHRQGPLVVKVFAKSDPSWSLKPFLRRIKAEREALADCPNVLPYQRALETERTGYLIRQWTSSNLYDRISTRPFLSQVEKRWIAFQLLMALKELRERGCSHGDIKTENVSVTSWNWVYLTDFASFKPTFLPLDDPSTFSYFFDTSARRTCYLAPERFYASGSDMAKRIQGLEFGKRDGKVTEAMDVFALGCVLAELWMEGTPPFTLSQLFKYREGQYSPETYLSEIEDDGIRGMIRSMLSLEPSDRMTAAGYISSYRSSVFPDIFFTFLHPFMSSLNDVGPPPAPAPARPSVPGTVTPTGLNEARMQTSLRSDADERVEKIWTEWGNVSDYLDREAGLAANESVSDGMEREEDATFPLRLHIPGLEDQPVCSGATEDGPALIVLSTVCSTLRNCVRPSSIIRALDILLALLKYLSDESKLDRLLPFVVTLLQDDVALVRSAALRTLTQTVLLIRTITPSNAAVFPEYILPNIRPLSTDPETLPRVTYAECIAPLAHQARRFLEMAEAMKADGTFKVANAQDFGSSPDEDNFDFRLQELQSQVQDHIGPLLSDSSSAVKRVLLYHVGELCAFFGPMKSNDAILAHIVTYLNTRDWLLRAAWNENAVNVAACVGARAVDEYILPLVSLSLADTEEFVIVKVLETLTQLAERRLLAKAKVWELVAQVTGFLCHPNIWIREGTAAFLTSVAKRMSPTDCWCILYPTVKRLLRADVKEITELSLLDNAREPLSRVVFEAAVAWAGRAGKSNFWSLPRATAKGAPRDAGVRTDEDHAQLEKMRKLGMKPEDEFKLSMLRDHIAKLASARSATPSRTFDANESLTSMGGAAMKDLGVVPQTVFFSIRQADPEPVNMVTRLARRISTDSSRATASGDQSRPQRSRTSSGQPVEDLRRRLALTSGEQHAASTDRSEQSPIGTHGDRLDLHRTVSAASTDMSDTTTTSTSTRGEIVEATPRSHVHRNVVEVGRAGAAVAEDGTNALGMFNVEKRYKADGGEDTESVAANQVSRAGSPFSRVVSGANVTQPARRLVTTYEGNDPNIKNLLERVYLDNYREPLPELGPHVPAGIPRRRALRTSFPPRERTPTRPEGTLIAHLVEHTAGITDIQVSPDQLFFVTGSEDGTAKVWDTIRLEKNVTSKSRQTFQQGGKVTAVCVLENSHCVASTSDNGTLWIHRVDVSLSGSMPKYGKPQLIRQQRFDKPGEFVTRMTSYNTETTTNLVMATSLAEIRVLDVRTMRTLHTFCNPAHLGPITALCVDSKHVWFIVGTASGSLSLWDLRFGILLRSWSVGQRKIEQVVVHPCRGKGRWILVATEDEPGSTADQRVLEIWDVDKGLRVEEVRLTRADGATGKSLVDADAPDVEMREASLDPAAAIEALLEQSEGQSTIAPKVVLSPADARAAIRTGVKAMLVGNDYANTDSRPSTTAMSSTAAKAIEQRQAEDGFKELGFLITGGEDRKLRFWDLAKPSKSVVVSGLDMDEEVPSYTYQTKSQPSLIIESTGPQRPRPGVPGATSSRVHRSTVIANSQQQMLRGHREAITALALIDLPFRCVVSGDRSGTIKVFE